MRTRTRCVPGGISSGNRESACQRPPPTSSHEYHRDVAAIHLDRDILPLQIGAPYFETERTDIRSYSRENSTFPLRLFLDGINFRCGFGDLYARLAA